MSFISVIIPCRNEEKNISATVEGIKEEFGRNKIHYEIIIVNDGSVDGTENILKELNHRDGKVRFVNNAAPYGIGNAIKKGLEEYKGDYVIIAMADASDDPKDMVRFVAEVEQGYDCCFGTRWKRGTVVDGYPPVKLILNRILNWVINILFGCRYTDVTNAFKCYSRQAIDGIKPILSHHFNITVELPLKAIVRGYSYSIIPNNWHGRKIGKSQLKFKEAGSRYLFIILYVLLEKWLSKGDYLKKTEGT